MASMSSKNSFTLIELVIVIGILAVLATAVILVLNHSELLKQSRDTRRLSDLAALNSALGYYQSDGKTSFGTSSVVYVSLPDSSPTCNNLGLPTLPSGWSYACSNSTNYRKVDSTGWLPVNLTLISFGSPLDTLPIDPVNTTSTGNYYMYTPGGSWELDALMESQTYRLGGSKDVVSKTGQGNYLYKTGSNLSLSPFSNSGLVGYWKFDEGSGTTVSDSSGNNNTGTWNGTGTHYTTGKVGSCAGQFNGTDDYVSFGNIGTIPNFTISEWIYVTPYNNGDERCFWSSQGSATFPIVTVYKTSGIFYLFFYYSGTNAGPIDCFSENNWYYISHTYDGTSIRSYVNRTLTNTRVGTAGTNFAQFTVGKGAYTPWNSAIDDVRVYNRALSAAEISAIYNATK